VISKFVKKTFAEFYFRSSGDKQIFISSLYSSSFIVPYCSIQYKFQVLEFCAVQAVIKLTKKRAKKLKVFIITGDWLFRG